MKLKSTKPMWCLYSQSHTCLDFERKNTCPIKIGLVQPLEWGVFSVPNCYLSSFDFPKRKNDLFHFF